jgi:hypothetical protein
MEKGNMKKIILHIGMHKTGTTAIQSAYNGYNDGSLSYADLGYENHSIPLYTIFSGAEERYHIWKSQRLSNDQIRNKKADLLNRLEGVFLNPPTENLLISGEDISALPESGVKELAALIAKHGFEAKILAYVRSPLSFMVSACQEEIKNGESLTTPPHPVFRHRVEKFIDTFGRDNVEIREFSRNALIGGDILADFAAATNTDMRQPGESSNQSLSTEALRVVYLLNQLVDSFRDSKQLVNAKQKCINDLRVLLPGTTKFPNEFISPLVDGNDVLWLKEATGIDFTHEIAKPVEKFNPAKMAEFLSAPTSETLETIYAALKNREVIHDLPRVPHFTIARYLMSFIQNQKIDRPFNPERYLDLNPDVKRAGVDPYRHYVDHGIKEGRQF